MPGRGDDEGWGGEHRAHIGRERLLSASLAAMARVLESESDRWFLWLPVLFAGGIITYSPLPMSPTQDWRQRFSSAPSGWPSP